MDCWCCGGCLLAHLLSEAPNVTESLRCQNLEMPRSTGLGSKTSRDNRIQKISRLFYLRGTLRYLGGQLVRVKCIDAGVAPQDRALTSLNAKPKELLSFIVFLLGFPIWRLAVLGAIAPIFIIVPSALQLTRYQPRCTEELRVLVTHPHLRDRKRIFVLGQCSWCCTSQGPGPDLGIWRPSRVLSELRCCPALHHKFSEGPSPPQSSPSVARSTVRHHGRRCPLRDMLRVPRDIHPRYFLDRENAHATIQEKPKL